MKYFKYLFICLILPLLSCEEDVESELGSFVGFEAKPTLLVPKNETQAFDVKVATSGVSNADRSYTVNVDENNLTIENQIPSEVVIPAGSNVGDFTVSLTDDETLGFEGQTLTLSLEPNSGVSVGEPITINVTERCDDVVVDLIITTDDWPDETTWQVFDLNGEAPEMIASGGPYVNPDDDFSEILEQLCLAPGDYGVVVFDSFGDGIVDGGFQIVVDGETLVDATVGGSSAQAEFTID
jgi:hypothetical protein